MYQIMEGDYVCLVLVHYALWDVHVPDPSIDAGGSRATSQLQILSNLMDRLNPDSEDNQTGLPCTVFDMIGGTGSGG
jgi:hypothetical protein